jgi:hypothetical protein
MNQNFDNLFKFNKPEMLARRIEEIMRYHPLKNMPTGTNETKQNI